VPVEWFNDLAAWWAAGGWPWISAWLQSPGFAGTAAVVAAFVAFRASRNAQRLDAWWKRVEWALDLYVPQDASDRDRRVGLAALHALQASKLAKKPESDFVAGVVDAVTLDPLGDGAEEDDWEEIEGSAADAASGAYSEQAEKGGDDDGYRTRKEGRS
jgi:hypothetical protein